MIVSLKHMKYAIISNPATGHLNPLINLGKELNSRGHQVTIYLPSFRSEFLRRFLNVPELNLDIRVTANGLSCRIIPVSLKQALLGMTIHKKKGIEEVLHALKLFSAGIHSYTNFLEKEFTENRPDAIIYDYTFFAAITASEKLNIKRISVYHSGLPFPEFPIPPIGSKFRYKNFTLEDFSEYGILISRQEEIARKLLEKETGSGTLSNLLIAPNSPDLNLITNLQEAEYPRSKELFKTYYTGPFLSGNFNTLTEKTKSDRKVIYISMGTVFNNQSEIYIKLTEACISLNAEIYISGGKSYRKIRKHFRNADVKIEKYINQREILSRADLFLTHGGKNSICESLYSGVPMIVFPVAAEQIYNGGLVEYLGAGYSIEQPENLSEDQLKEKIKMVLNDKELYRKLKDISEKFQSNDGLKKACDLIEELP
jgi:MGT family glycosyltransferase